MVERSTIRIMGSVVLALGIGWTLASSWLARKFAKHLRLRPDRRDGSPRPTSQQRMVIQRWMKVWNIFGGLMVALVGGLWLAGTGTS